MNPLDRYLRRPLFGRVAPLESLASKVWQCAPPETRMAPQAVFLPGQFERIRGLSPFAESLEAEQRRLRGGEGAHGATRAMLLKDVVLADGVLGRGRGRMYLHHRHSRLPRLRLREDAEPAALYSSYAGNRWFAHWLMDDCATYHLAAQIGRPLATRAPSPTPHMRGYEALLHMKARRCDHTRFRELTVFDDLGQNRNKAQRFRRLSRTLALAVEAQRHPGVFLVRGATGERRVLLNEGAIAERLRVRRGWRVVDASRMSAEQVVRACAGAEVVAGVEGSQLIHGIVALSPGGGLLTLQPPTRFFSIYKDITDREDQTFGFVVGTPQGEDFEVDADEVERTLDLMAMAQAASHTQALHD